MKKLCIACVILVSLASFTPFSQETPIQKITARFLKVIESKNETEGKKFVEENYSDFFLNHVPMNIHLKVMNDLQKDYYKSTVVSKTFTATKVVLVIRSAINNKQKQVSMETDPANPQKIFIVDVKEVNAGN